MPGYNMIEFYWTELLTTLVDELLDTAYESPKPLMVLFPIVSRTKEVLGSES